MPNHIQITKNWVKNFIIDHNICPFARREFDRDSILYQVIEFSELAAQLEALINSCELLDSDESIATCLQIFPNGLNQFDHYLEFLDLANALLLQQKYEGIYQLASFHPRYQFDGSSADDPANYTNRSPFPMLHIIRESSLEQALENFPDPETIPERNIDYTRNLGLIELRRILSECDNKS